MSDIWKVNGKTWYSGKLVDKVVALCEKEINKDIEYNFHIAQFAQEILELLHQSEGK